MTAASQPHQGPVMHLVGTPIGLTARTIQRTRPDSDGTRRIVLQGGKRLRDKHVDLMASTAPDPAALEAVLNEGRQGDRSFILGASTRTWSTVKARFADNAWPRAIDLVRAGAITLRCEVTDDLALGTPLRWHLTIAGRGQARLHKEAREATRNRITTTLQRARDAIRDLDALPDGIDPDDLQYLDDALVRELDRPVPAPKRTAILAAVARDLGAGIRHASPRAFSLAHTRNTKTWDDAISTLRESGIPTALVEAVGLRGHSRVGLGGPITALARGHHSRLDDLGIVLLPAAIAGLRLELRSRTLIVVENLQAAESLYDAFVPSSQRPGIIYHAGMPSHDILKHITGLADQAARVVIAPDADLGGTRIATAIWSSLTPSAQQSSMICDVGLAPAHTPQEPWSPDSPVWADLRTMLSSPAAPLAQGCLSRGYPVEQEGCVVEAVIALLNAELGP
ncbi:DUF2399 domain-containing protein [Kitasatospora acidiphila]|uniref:DUF2399 domain-containing protein n=1 Tax=Kitasatospora acidiphila TaxID=2567942 RepID=A0A540W0W9_9ACTN|nr:DUF2399 domain-containing protein [Kitasatospora acidiphila]TQF01994.1 DUF2399 domain-containing protein [Kitasatospora acidiphila]